MLLPIIETRVYIEAFLKPAKDQTRNHDIKADNTQLIALKDNVVLGHLTGT